MKNGGDLSGRRIRRGQESFDPVDVGSEDLENKKEVEREAQDPQGLNK